jgi:hypothetical protein
MDVRKSGNTQDVPFVCWQNDRSKITSACIEDALQAAALLGASLCLPYDLVRTLSDNELRQTLEECLPNGNGKDRTIGQEGRRITKPARDGSSSR